MAKEDPARYDSQSNGLTEVGVMLVRGLFRSLKLCLESSIRRRIPKDHALMPWLLEHTCLILSTTVRALDGATAWRRIRGRDFHGNMAGFGEQVLYKLPGKGFLSKLEGNMGTKLEEGTYLGHSVSSNTYILDTPEGLVEARAIQRRPESERWSADALADIAATPWSILERPETRVIFRACGARRPRRRNSSTRNSTTLEDQPT